MKSVFPADHGGSFRRLGYRIYITVMPRYRRLVRQAGTTLVAATLQDEAAGTGCHTLHKTVLLGTMTFFGLVRSLGHGVTFLKIIYLQV